MKNSFKIFIFLLVCLYAASLRAQPEPYIIPDIGAPGMNVYVEMISVYNDDPNPYGEDGIYFKGGNNDVRIDFLDESDSNLVTLGPLFVMWDGRMIATQIFVNPNANPTSTYKDINIELQVMIDGNPKDVFNFYIVQPQQLGDISAINENVLGEGSLGFRSERGAMIVDSLILDPNKNYRVSTSPDEDPDERLDGNQGYLPFVLLSKGSIKGNGSTISVNANGKHAGPGGGGGGGEFVDAGITNTNPSGTSGGRGFTGGGKGGRNGSGISSDNYEDIGAGTLSDGYSINGIPNDDPATGWEASYGGTGHPFGDIGNQSRSNTSSSEQGGYGGGSGHTGDQRGGSGGYAENGDGIDHSNGNTGGKSHGNNMTIPIAGGSGGAGGNPNGNGFSAERGGEGGGGGGAARVFAQTIDNLVLTANGAAGTNGGDAYGGSGSGGFANLMSKLGMTDIELTANPGNNKLAEGGAGRVRYDGYAERSPPDYSPANASEYRGLSTDTSRFVKKQFNITGYYDNPKYLDIYLKPSNENWRLYNNDRYPSNSWQRLIDISTFDADTFYLVAVQKEDKRNGDHDYSPENVLSQAAANILILDGPDIYCPEDTSFSVKKCIGEEYEDSILVRSIGGEDLEIDLDNSSWAFGDKGLELSESGVSVVPSPPDTPSEYYVKFKYTHQPGQTGSITDTLILSNNTTNGKDPCRIVVTINIEEVDLTFLDNESLMELDTFWLQTVCVGETVVDTFLIRNDSEFIVDSLELIFEKDIPNKDFNLDPTKYPDFEPENAPLPIVVTFNDPDENEFYNGVKEKVYVYDGDCLIDSIFIGIKVREAQLSLDVESLDFGNVPVGNEKELSVVVTNDKDIPAVITNPPSVDPPFYFVSSDPPLPYTLDTEAPDNTIEFTFSFRPTDEQAYEETSLINSERSDSPFSCYSDTTLTLTGNGVDIPIPFPDTLDFGVLYECNDEGIFNGTFSNPLPLDYYFEYFEIIGQNADDFEVIQFPDTVKSGESEGFIFRFFDDENPAKPGVKLAKFDFVIQPFSSDTFSTILKAEIDVFDIDIDPNPVDFGDVPINFTSSPATVTITNNGKLPRTITSFNLPAAPPVVEVTPENTTIDGGESETFEFTIEPDEAIQYDLDVVAEFERCDNEMVINLLANGIEGELAEIPDIDLGIIHPCFNETVSVDLENEGDVPITIDSVKSIIEGDTTLFPDPRDFELVKGQPLPVDVRIAANNQLGDIRGTLIIYITENGVEYEYPVVIRAEVRSGIVLTPPGSFGNVRVNSTETMTFTISKDEEADFTENTDITFEIDQANLSPNYPEFNIVDQGPFTLTEADPDQEIRVEFTPTDDITYTSELEIPINLIDFPCPFDDYVQFDGTGLKGDSLIVWIPEITATPDIDNFRIPVYAKLNMSEGSNVNPDTNYNVALRSLNIEFNSTLFFPEDLTNGEFFRRYSDGNTTYLSIKTNAKKINYTDTTLITELLGPTLLGNERSTILQADSLLLFDSTFVTYTESRSGLLDLQVCEADGDRLLNYTEPINFDYTLMNDKINIDIRIIEAGYHSVIISDINGRSRVLKEIVRNRNSRKEYNLKIDKDEFSSGVYFLRLQTPERVKTLKLILVD